MISGVVRELFAGIKYKGADFKTIVLKQLRSLFIGKVHEVGARPQHLSQVGIIDAGTGHIGHIVIHRCGHRIAFSRPGNYARVHLAKRSGLLFVKNDQHGAGCRVFFQDIFLRDPHLGEGLLIEGAAGRAQMVNKL